MALENVLYDVCIIGSGPAGHTAAIYTSRAHLKTIMFEGWMANGIAPGGQLTTTTLVENFPGFPDGILGIDFCTRLREQSSQFGTTIISETITDIMPLQMHPPVFEVVSENGTSIKAKSLIIATGASAKKLDFKGSDTYWNAGISACAVCDGALPMFRNNDIAVIGGGDSAMEEASYLTKYAKTVYIIHRKDTFNASKIMQERALHNPKIKVIWNSEVIEAFGKDGLLDGVKLRNNKTNDEQTLNVKGLFYAVGHVPASQCVKHLVETDEYGYILTKPNSTETSYIGIFAAGDVQDKKWRQAITAAGSGCMAALEVEHFVTSTSLN